MIKSHRLGECTLYFLHDGDFKVDCGSYFGIVPRVMWEKIVEFDELSRCTLHLCPLLVVTPEHHILIDPGIGDKFTDKQIRIYGIDRSTTLQSSLKEIGLSTDDIDFVIPTHLHFDHFGAATRYDEDGNAVPVFGNAVHVIQKGEWEEATHPDERTKGTYFLENYVPLQSHRLVRFIEGDTEISPHVSVEVTGGHTRWHQAVFIRSEGETAVYTGDILPDVNHLQIAYVAAMDQYPVEMMQRRREYYRKAIDEKWLLCLDHDPNHRAGYLSYDGKKYHFEAIL